MKKILATLAVAATLACAPATVNSTISGTGTPGPAKMQLEVENNNWSLAKIYLVTAGSSSGYRIASVEGMTTTTVSPMVHAPRFQIQIELLGYDGVAWISEIWSGSEKCLTLNIREYVALTYMMLC